MLGIESLGRLRVALATTAHPLGDTKNYDKDRPRKSGEAGAYDIEVLKQEQETEQDNQYGKGFVMSAAAR